MRQEKIRRAALAVARELERGLALDQAGAGVLVMATDAADARAAVALVLAGRESADLAPLAALLFSPDLAAMRRLEPVLAGACLDGPGAEALGAAVAGLFQDGQRRAWLVLPEGQRVDLEPTAGDLLGFVRGLRPAATAPAELCAILSRRCGPELAADLGARLRHCRLAWTPGQVFFLGTLLERADTGADTAIGSAAATSAGDLPGLVLWAVGLLGCAGEGGPQEILARRRQALLAQLRQAGHLEEALARGSYEVLMSQGVRLAHVHGPSIRAELAHLDRASLLVLGLPGEALDRFSVRDLGRAEDAGALLRLMPELED